jgi:hypothetical protein
MGKHRNPQASVSKQAPSDNFNPGIVGHLDNAIATGPLGDHVVVYTLTEFLGDPRSLAGPDGAASADRVAYDGAPMLASGKGGAS